MRRKGKFDAIIVETTGLADPAPVAQTFFVDEDIGRAQARRRGHGGRRQVSQARLKDAPEAKNQIAFADVILLNKADLVTPAELTKSRRAFAASIPTPPCIGPQRCASPLERCSAATLSTSTAFSRSSRRSSTTPRS